LYCTLGFEIYGKYIMMTDCLWRPLNSHNTHSRMAYLHFDDVLLSLGSLLPGKVLCLGVQSLLKQWQCKLGTNGCSRVIAGHIDELGF